VEPNVVTGGSRATFTLVATNEGNVAAEVAPTVVDPEDQSRVVLEPHEPLSLPPGRRAVVEVQVRSTRHWLGPPKPKLLTFDAPGATAPLVATFVQKPRISRLLLSLLGLLLAALVFGAVIRTVINTVSEENAVPPALLDEALRSGNAPGERASQQQLVITGVLVASTGEEALVGVEAELFRADNPTVAVRTAATAADGRYAFSGLDATDYYLRFSGAGYPTLWYPGVESLTEALTLTPTPAADTASTGPPAPANPGGAVAAQGPSSAPPALSFPAEPGTISGTVTADSPTGTRVTVVLASAPSGSPPVVAEAPVSLDGSYTVSGIPTPGRYRVLIQKAGAAVEQREVRLAPGGDATVDVTLRDADGSIAGQVTSRGSALGGVTISATDGLAVLRTVSLTENPIGSFELRGLSVPATYTVTASREGYASQTRAVSLGDEQPVSLSFDLLPAIGAISGQVSVAGFGPTGGVLVTVTGGEVEVTTSTLSQGAVGSFRVEDLPAPGTYTVTFTRADLETQSIQVALDPARGDVDPVLGVVEARGVSVALTSASASVQGVVLDVGGAAVPGATIELTDGKDPRTLVSADEPRGAFGFTNLRPGAYVLRAALPGATPTVQLVNLRPGDLARLEVRLERQAALSGVVLDALGQPLDKATVRLYAADAFPAPASAALQTFTTGPDGRYSFVNVDAPAAFVVAAFRASTEDVPFAIQVVTSQQSTDVPVPPLVVPA
jgi:Carboxypeptidase regulatory-like domain